MPLRLVVFDVDGTLVDSQHHIHAAMGHAFAAEGLAPPDLAAVQAIVGLSLPQAMAVIAPHLGPSQWDRLVLAYKAAFLDRRLKDDAPLYDGAAACITALAGRDDLLLGIATGKGRRGLLAMLDHHGLRGAFVTLQCADDHPSKPDPSMLRAALAEAGVAARDAVMIGDTSYDMAMARAAGVQGIGVGWGYHPPEAMRCAGAEVVVADFRALNAHLSNWTTVGTTA